MAKSQFFARILQTIFLLALVALAWLRPLDDSAQIAAQEHFQRALAVAAIARVFNGAVSVAQGTEVAIQPVGVGVTLTLGEILDPINDLIERFSLLALVASVSLGLQLTLGQMTASIWVSAAMSIVITLYLLNMWISLVRQNKSSSYPNSPTPTPASALGFSHRRLIQLVTLTIFMRFLLVAALLTTNLINSVFLKDSQDQAVAELGHTSTAVAQIQNQQSTQMSAEELGFYDRTSQRVKELLNTSKQSLDLKAQLAQLQDKLENSVEEMINLIVIFLLQTLILPILTGWGFWQLLKTLLSR